MSDYRERCDRACAKAGLIDPRTDEGAWNRRYRAALEEEGLELRSAVQHSDIDRVANDWVWAPICYGGQDGWRPHCFIADLRA